MLPPEDLTGLRALASFVESHGRRAALVGPDGERVDLPEAVYAVLVDVVRSMQGGRAVTVAPTSTRLTTQEAADLLGVSRPTLVKLLESGRIPTSGQVSIAGCVWRTCSSTATLPARSAERPRRVDPTGSLDRRLRHR